MPGYEQKAVMVDSDRARDGIIDVRHEDGSATRFYDQTQYAAPRGDYTVYEDRNGGQWYAISGTPSVERRPVYENGKPVQDDSGKLITTQVETIRYKNTLTRFAQPQRQTPEAKPPRRKQ